MTTTLVSTDVDSYPARIANACAADHPKVELNMARQMNPVYIFEQFNYAAHMTDAELVGHCEGLLAALLCALDRAAAQGRVETCDCETVDCYVCQGWDATVLLTALIGIAAEARDKVRT